MSTLSNIQGSSFSTSLFARLPGELRNRIYEALVPIDTTFTMSSDGHWNDRPTSDLTALFQSCKQVCTETSAMFYSSNHFIIEICQNDLEHLSHWLDGLGSQYTRHLRSISLCQVGHQGLATYNFLLSDPHGIDLAVAKLCALGVCRDAIWQNHNLWHQRQVAFYEFKGYPPITMALLQYYPPPTTSDDQEVQGIGLCRLCWRANRFEPLRSHQEHIEGDVAFAQETVLGWDSYDSKYNARKALWRSASTLLKTDPVKRKDVKKEEAVFQLAIVMLETGLPVAMAKDCLDACGWLRDAALLLFAKRRIEVPEEAYDRSAVWQTLAKPDGVGETALTALPQWMVHAWPKHMCLTKRSFALREMTEGSGAT